MQSSQRSPREISEETTAQSLLLVSMYPAAKKWIGGKALTGSRVIWTRPAFRLIPEHRHNYAFTWSKKAYISQKRSKVEARLSRYPLRYRKVKWDSAPSKTEFLEASRKRRQVLEHIQVRETKAFHKPLPRRSVTCQKKARRVSE